MSPRTAPQPVDWAAVQYQPDPRVPLLRCRCGGAFLDDEPGRRAHDVVFGHQPVREREPEASDGM